MPNSYPRAALAALGLLAVTAACGPASSSGSQPPPPPPGPAVSGDQTVLLTEDNEFDPDALRVIAGTTVTWEWGTDLEPHNVTFDAFASDTQTEGTYRHAFDEPGAFAYTCTLHPQMTGLVVVG